ncbi:MAG: DUF4785 domain-containing protein [Rhodanobacteraceae bacterium]
MTTFTDKTIAFLAAGLLVPAMALAASASLPQGTMPLLKASVGDQVPERLISGEPATVDIDHAPVHVSWTLPAGQTLKSGPQPFKRVSRDFIVDASGAELERGVAVPLSGSGAMLRISPRDQGSAPLSAAQVHVTYRGLRKNVASISSTVASGQLMARAGMPMQAGSVALRLDSSIAAGTIHVDAAGARGHYVVQVREPQSPFALTLAANHDTRLAGQPIEVRAQLEKPARSNASMDAISGVLEAPDGWSTDITFSPQPDHGYLASFTPPAGHAGQRGLWQVHVFASGHDGQRELLRDASNAFAAVRPTARLTGLMSRQPNRPGQDLAFDFGIETAAPSRYAVSAVLYGHDRSGALKPAVYAQSADWLAPGKGQYIRLRFDTADVAASGLSAPFELRDLRLDDQVQLGLLERRQIAARGIAAHD